MRDHRWVLYTARNEYVHNVILTGSVTLRVNQTLKSLRWVDIKARLCMVKSCNIYTIPRTIQNLTFVTSMDQQTWGSFMYHRFGWVHKLTINLYLSSRSMVTAVPPSTSSSQLGHVSDRNVMKTILQSCLKCLDRHNDKIINISSEMLEIRTCFMELLDNVQAEATVIDSATGDYSAYLQETFSDEPQNIATVAPDEPNAMSPPLTVLDVLDLPQPLANDGLLDQGYGSSRSVGVMGSLPEDTNPMIFQRSPGKFATFSARKTLIVHNRHIALRHPRLCQLRTRWTNVRTSAWPALWGRDLAGFFIQTWPTILSPHCTGQSRQSKVYLAWMLKICQEVEPHSSCERDTLAEG